MPTVYQRIVAGCELAITAILEPEFARIPFDEQHGVLRAEVLQRVSSLLAAASAQVDHRYTFGVSFTVKKDAVNRTRHVLVRVAPIEQLGGAGQLLSSIT